MKAGTYFIGDLSYVMQDSWKDVINLVVKGYDVVPGEYKLEEGIEFAIYQTTYGDGLYADNSRREYSVDSGIIGCVQVDSIPSQYHSKLKLGQVIKFNNDFDTGVDDGIIRFGDTITIDTVGAD